METKIVRHKVEYKYVVGFVWTESDAACKIGDHVLINSEKIVTINTEAGEENAILWNVGNPNRVLKVVAASSKLGIKVPTYNQYVAYKVSLLLPILEVIRIKKEKEEWQKAHLNRNFIPVFDS